MFFNRFMHEVVERGDGTIAGALEATRPELTWGFVKTFEMLDRVVDELRRDRSRTKLAQAVTMYHFVVEATLAQPGQHFISDYLKSATCCPASAPACTTSRSTSSATSASASSCCAISRSRTRRCRMPWPSSSAPSTPVPRSPCSSGPAGTPATSSASDSRCEEVYEQGAPSLESKFHAAGLPIDPLLGPQVHAHGPARRETRASAGSGCCGHGYLGERTGRPGATPRR